MYRAAFIENQKREFPMGVHRSAIEIAREKVAFAKKAMRKAAEQQLKSNPKYAQLVDKIDETRVQLRSYERGVDEANENSFAARITRTQEKLASLERKMEMADSAIPELHDQLEELEQQREELAAELLPDITGDLKGLTG
jgi:uncharacterized coiled-coil DUF342 family protein